MDKGKSKIPEVIELENIAEAQTVYYTPQQVAKKALKALQLLSSACLDGHLKTIAMLRKTSGEHAEQLQEEYKKLEKDRDYYKQLYNNSKTSKQNRR